MYMSTTFISLTRATGETDCARYLCSRNYQHTTAERSIEEHPSGSPPCQISNQKDSSAVLCLVFSPFALTDHDCSETTCTAFPSPRQPVPAPASCETSFDMSESALQMKFGSVSGIKSSRRG